MKIGHTIVLLLLVAMPARAQKTTLQAGFVASDVLFFVNGATIETTRAKGFFGGLETEVKLRGDLHGAVGIGVVPVGYRVVSDTNTYLFRLTYIQVPLLTRIKFDLETFRMSFDAGPYLGYALDGFIKSNNTRESLDFGSNPDEIKHMDAGLSMGCVIEFDAIRFRISYQTGLRNIASNPVESMKNRALLISLGLLL